MGQDTSRTEATLLQTDWNAEWMALQRARRSPDKAAFWNERAKHFKPRETRPYARDFIALMEARPGESVMDMGCGGGSIAIPLAQVGHPVLAADFSPAMLHALQEGIDCHGLQKLIDPRLLAWDDDWPVHGIEPKSVDIAIASRSIATSDLQAALLKLDTVARRRCCISLVANASPRYDTHILDAIGASVTASHDYVYAFNILVGLGVTPEVRYIDSARRDTFGSLEDGVRDFTRMLEGGNEHRIGELRTYIAEHMVENPHEGEPGSKGMPQGRYMLDHERVVRWAFIAWTPRKGADAC